MRDAWKGKAFVTSQTVEIVWLIDGCWGLPLLSVVDVFARNAGSRWSRAQSRENYYQGSESECDHGRLSSSLQFYLHAQSKRKWYGKEWRIGAVES